MKFNLKSAVESTANDSCNEFKRKNRKGFFTVVVTTVFENIFYFLFHPQCSNRLRCDSAADFKFRRLLTLIGMTLPICLLASPAWASASPDPTVVASTMIGNIRHLAVIAEIFSIIAGLGLFLGGLFEMKRYGEMRSMMSQQVSIGKPLAMIISGVALLSLPTMIGTMLLAIWGNSSPIAYSSTSSSSYSPFLPVVVDFVRVVGIFAFMRGIFLISRAGGGQGQPGMLGKGLVHIIGGVLCINVVATHALLASLLP